MKSKFSLRLISVLGSSLLVMLQFVPLAKAQSGNMSDGTGVNINSGNMSDATGIDLEALLDGTLTEINGIAITAEFRAFLLSIINGSFEFNSVFNALIDSGVPANLATACVTSLRGLFVNGQINLAQLQISGQIYQQILIARGVNYAVLSRFGILQSITTLLAIYGQDISFPFASIFAIGSEFNGITITAEIRQLILELSSGNTRGIGQLVSVLRQSGVQGSVAAKFAQSLRGLFVNGRLNIAQFIIAGQLYQQIISTRGVNISFLSNFGLFRSITSILIAFGIDVNFPVLVGVPVGPGNQSDATNPLPANVDTEEAEEVAEGEAEEVAEEETAEEVAEGEAEEVAEEETAQEVAEEETVAESEVESSEGEEAETSEEVAEVATTSVIQSTTSTTTTNVTTTSSAQGNSSSNLSDSTGVLISSNRNNAGFVSSMNAIVTTSDIVGGTFQFATSNILMAVLKRAQSLMALLLGSGQVSFAGVSISIEVRQTVVSVMTSSSSFSASVPTYVSSLNGGGTLTTAASVDSYTNSLIDGGVPVNYARALASTMDGILTVDENGEVTGVDATKLTTATAVYNETVNQLDAEAVSEPSEMLTCTGFALSQLAEAAASAANE
jgi:hypothetical protein